MSFKNSVLVVDHFKIDLAKSATTDGMTITVTAQDRNNKTVLQKVPIELWMSEDSGGMGLTTAAYSGTLTASTGAILTALTAKKHITAVTAATGVAVFVLVDSVNPANQYVAVRNPDGSLTVSGSSAQKWEGS